MSTTANNAVFAAAATRIAAKYTAHSGQVVPAKAVRPTLQEVRLVRTGGNAANGLLAVGGASLLINQRLAVETGITVASLLQEVAACPRVSNPIGKVSDHINNNVAYSDKARLASCGILQALRSDGIKTVLPAVCLNGKPLMRLTRKELQTLMQAMPDAVLTSPLLAAIAAYTQGKPCPDWARAYAMPAQEDATQEAATTQTKTARKRNRSKAI